MDSRRVIQSLFGVPRALIGVIHAQALPGTPASSHASPMPPPRKPRSTQPPDFTG